MSHCRDTDLGQIAPAAQRRSAARWEDRPPEQAEPRAGSGDCDQQREGLRPGQAPRRAGERTRRENAATADG